MKIALSDSDRALVMDAARQLLDHAKLLQKSSAKWVKLETIRLNTTLRGLKNEKNAAMDSSAAMQAAGANLQLEKLAPLLAEASARLHEGLRTASAIIREHNKDAWRAIKQNLIQGIHEKIEEALVPYFRNPNKRREIAHGSDSAWLAATWTNVRVAPSISQGAQVMLKAMQEEAEILVGIIEGNIPLELDFTPRETKQPETSPELPSGSESPEPEEGAVVGHQDENGGEADAAHRPASTVMEKFFITPVIHPGEPIHNL